eukprot:s340_g14.t2
MAPTILRLFACSSMRIAAFGESISATASTVRRSSLLSSSSSSLWHRRHNRLRQLPLRQLSDPSPGVSLVALVGGHQENDICLEQLSGVEMEQHQAVVDEQLRQNRSDYNATLGDMKALWREIAALQTQTASAKERLR